MISEERSEFPCKSNLVPFYLPRLLFYIRIILSVFIKKIMYYVINRSDPISLLFYWTGNVVCKIVFILNVIRTKNFINCKKNCIGISLSTDRRGVHWSQSGKNTFFPKTLFLLGLTPLWQNYIRIVYNIHICPGSCR